MSKCHMALLFLPGKGTLLWGGLVERHSCQEKRSRINGFEVGTMCTFSRIMSESTGQLEEDSLPRQVVLRSLLSQT